MLTSRLVCCSSVAFMLLFVCFFFFQAEDGIRDWSVTGVQTCALPIFDPVNPGVVPGATYAASPVNLTAAWANEGGDKVVRSELRGTNNAAGVANSDRKSVV